MYAYCGNSPVIRYDPTGRLSITTLDELRERLEEQAKESIDNIVHISIAIFDPFAFIVFRKLHYSRNYFNEVPQTEEEALAQNYILLDEKDDKFHQNNQQGGRNRKYISQDGHHEVVYYSNGQLNDTPEDEGTYNVFSCVGSLLERYVGHLIFDVYPYMVWGNSPDDDTTIVDRFLMIGN